MPLLTGAASGPSPDPRRRRQMARRRGNNRRCRTPFAAAGRHLAPPTPGAAAAGAIWRCRRRVAPPPTPFGAADARWRRRRRQLAGNCRCRTPLGAADADRPCQPGPGPCRQLALPTPIVTPLLTGARFRFVPPTVAGGAKMRAAEGSGPGRRLAGQGSGAKRRPGSGRDGRTGSGRDLPRRRTADGPGLRAALAVQLRRQPVLLPFRRRGRIAPAARRPPGLQVELVLPAVPAAG